MKKMIITVLTVLALSALCIPAFAAETAENAEKEGTETTAPAAEESAITAALTKEQALAAALKDAGEKESNVTVTKNVLSEKEKQDGGKIAVYSVKFNTDTTTYNYYLDADTGAVLMKSYVYNSPDVVFKNQDRLRNHGGAGGKMHGKGKGKASGQAGSGTSGETSADSTSKATTSE